MAVGRVDTLRESSCRTHVEIRACRFRQVQDIGPIFHINGAGSSVVGSRKCSSGRILVATG